MPCSRSLPAGEILIDALDFFVAAGGLGGSFVRLLAVDFVAHADWNLRQFVEHIELGDHQPGDAVDHAGVAQERQVEPAGAAGTSGDRAIFVAALAQQLAGSPFSSLGKGLRRRGCSRPW
jgi:hypothetical protein